MRDLNLEAAIWYLFTSVEFFEAAARECEETMQWFGTLATTRRASDLGRNNEVFDKFQKLAREFRRGADLARYGDYQLVWDTAGQVRGDVRGVMEQPLRSWMSETEYKQFSSVRISRVLAYASLIESALNNAFTGAESFFDPDLDCPERANDDDGYPGEDIIRWYKNYTNWDKGLLFAKISTPPPQYVIDRSILCHTGDEVPWTGVWYPSTGLEKHSLTFAIKGLRMQPVYRVIKTTEELRTAEYMFPPPETVAVATTWHPVIPSGRSVDVTEELRTKAGESCPKAGIWEAVDVGAVRRSYEVGETMGHLGSAYGLTVWRWVAER